MPRPPLSAQLTTTELCCLKAASYGLGTEETAQAFGITFEQARTARRDARRKLAAKNTGHAIAEAFRLGLIT